MITLKRGWVSQRRQTVKGSGANQVSVRRHIEILFEHTQSFRMTGMTEGPTSFSPYQIALVINRQRLQCLECLWLPKCRKGCHDCSPHLR